MTPRDSQTGIQKAMGASKEHLSPAQLRMAKWSFGIGASMLVAKMFQLPAILAKLAGIDYSPGIMQWVVVLLPFTVAAGAVLPSGLSGAGAFFSHIFEAIKNRGKKPDG